VLRVVHGSDELWDVDRTRLTMLLDPAASNEAYQAIPHTAIPVRTPIFAAD
jgi:hypothetical protein